MAKSSASCVRRERSRTGVPSEEVTFTFVMSKGRTVVTGLGSTVLLSPRTASKHRPTPGTASPGPP